MKHLIKLINTCILFLTSSIIIAQIPDELYRGRHQIDGMNWGHPYTVFDRQNGDSNFVQTISKIRMRIIEESNPTINGPVFKAYKAIVQNAQESIPTDNGLIAGSGSSTTYSALAIWAKNNAFVFLIGLDEDANWMDTTEYNGVKSNAKRDAFRDRVYMPNQISMPMNPYLTDKSAFSHFVGEVPHDNGDMQFCSRSLIFWLQAYDLFKAA